MLGGRREKQTKMCVYTKTHLKRDMLANVKPGDKKKYLLDHLKVSDKLPCLKALQT